MKNLIRPVAIAAIVCLFSVSFFLPASFAQITRVKVIGIASKGGRLVRTSPSVSYKLMETYPSCTVTVYLTGTLTLASLYIDEAGTPKSNPFTANSDASYEFYVDVGRYDIKFSGTGIAVPFTIGDFFTVEAGGGGGGAVTSVFGRTGVVVAQANDYDFNQLDFAGSSLASIATRSASDLNAGTLPDAQFPATLPAISGINLTNLNASNIASGTLADTRLSSNIPKKDAINTFSADNYFTANIGINTLTPDRKLDILDASFPQLRLSSVDTTVYTDLYTDFNGNFKILPTGSVIFDATSNQIDPANNYDQNLGQINKKYLSIHAAELQVETLVAQDTIATIGGRILVAPTTTLIADLAPAATTINVKHNNLTNGDVAYMESNGSVEFFAITSAATPIGGGYSYSVTRNLDGSGANQWYAGDAMLNTGATGSGFIDLYSIRGVKSISQEGPTIVGNIRNSSSYNDWTENWAIGNLNGLYGYAVDTYGIGLGKYASNVYHITVDSTNGIRIFDGLSTVNSSWDTNGITIGGVGAGLPNLKIGAGTLAIRLNTTERIKLNADGSGFLANSLIAWDTSGNLTVTGNATIAGWTIGTAKISSTGIDLNSGGSAGLAFGTTPPTSATTGTGIWLDRTGLYGLASNVLQAKVDAATGAFTAGAGKVVLDANGLTIITSAGKQKVSTIAWQTGGTTHSSIYSTNSGNHDLTIHTEPGASTSNSFLRLFSEAPTGGGYGEISLNAFVTGPTSDINLVLNSSFGGYVNRHFLVGATATPATSAALEVQSTDGAVLFPRMTTTQRDALTAADGMIIYNTSTSKFQGRQAGAWVDLAP